MYITVHCFVCVTCSPCDYTGQKILEAGVGTSHVNGPVAMKSVSSNPAAEGSISSRLQVTGESPHGFFGGGSARGKRSSLDEHPYSPPAVERLLASPSPTTNNDRDASGTSGTISRNASFKAQVEGLHGDEDGVSVPGAAAESKAAVQLMAVAELERRWVKHVNLLCVFFQVIPSFHCRSLGVNEERDRDREREMRGGANRLGIVSTERSWMPVNTPGGVMNAF